MKTPGINLWPPYTRTHNAPRYTPNTHRHSCTHKHPSTFPQERDRLSLYKGGKKVEINGIETKRWKNKWESWSRFWKIDKKTRVLSKLTNRKKDTDHKYLEWKDGHCSRSRWQRQTPWVRGHHWGASCKHWLARISRWECELYEYWKAALDLERWLTG